MAGAKIRAMRNFRLVKWFASRKPAVMKRRPPYVKIVVFCRTPAVTLIVYLGLMRSIASQVLPDPPVYGQQVATDGVVGKNSIPVGRAVTIDVDSEGRYVVHPIGHVCEPPLTEEVSDVKSSIAEYVYANETFRNKVAQGLSASMSGSYGALGGSASMNATQSNLLKTQKTSFLFASRIEAERTFKDQPLEFSADARQTFDGYSAPTFTQVYGKFGDGVVSAQQTTASILIDVDLSSLSEDIRREITGSMTMNYAQVFSGSVSGFYKMSTKRVKEKVQIKTASNGFTPPTDIPTSGPIEKEVMLVDDLLKKANDAILQNGGKSSAVTSVKLQSAATIRGYPSQSGWAHNFDRVRELRLQRLAATHALTSMQNSAGTSTDTGISFDAPDWTAAVTAGKKAEKAMEDVGDLPLSDDTAFDPKYESARQEVGAFRNEVQKLYDLQLPVTLHTNASFEAAPKKIARTNKPGATISCKFTPTLSLNNTSAPRLSLVWGQVHVNGTVVQSAKSRPKVAPKSGERLASPAPEATPSKINDVAITTTFDCKGLLQPLGELRVDQLKPKNVLTGTWGPAIEFPDAPLSDYEDKGRTIPNTPEAPLQVTVAIHRKPKDNKNWWVYASGRITLDFKGVVKLGDLESVIH
jgi:hypothetical protein